MMITLSLDATKIDKTYLGEGKKGQKYLNLVLSENREGKDQYGNDGVVKQSVPKELRDTVKLPIIGNFKKWERPDNRKEAVQRMKAAVDQVDTGEDKQCPF